MNEIAAPAATKKVLPPPEPIRTQRLMKNRGCMPGPIFWIILVLSIPTFFGALLMAAMILPVGTAKRHFRKGRLLKAAAIEFPKFVQVSAKYLNVSSATATTGGVGANGIAYADGRLFIMEDGLAAEIPWRRIRSWTWKIAGYETTTLHGGAGLGTSINVQGQNLNSAWKAECDSGFFVTVSDVEKSEWQFKTQDEKLLKQWMEILNQMNSGELPRR